MCIRDSINAEYGVGGFRGSPIATAGSMSMASVYVTGNLTNITGAPSGVIVTQQTTSVLSVVHYFQSTSRTSLDTAAAQTATLDAVTGATVGAGFSGTYSTVYLSSECSFDASPFPTTNELYPGSLSCPQSVVLTFKLALSAPASTVLRSLCQVLPSCADVNVTVSGVSATATIGGADPVETITVVRNALARPSGMTVLQVESLTADGNTIFASKKVVQSSATGDISSCASKMWWLVFFILLLPLLYLLLKFAHRSGMAHGMKKAEVQHKDEKEKLVTLQNTYQPMGMTQRPPQQWEQWQQLQEQQFRSHQAQTAAA
eukprot:TRINITY_DN29133_c0_g1_i1.p1 TRINITY_DN29133_c0_g1~~TRINITY_DN29133_c0_g1_i1.p1  ORF type:complete len:317 (-),score=45.62 TRINITY_DN29133_c0_g1_i1:9-959(-)